MDNIEIKEERNIGREDQIRMESSQERPNQTEQKVIYNGNTRRPMAKVVERVLNNSLGDKLDALFMATTLKLWKTQFKDLGDANFELALKTRKYVSKHHPQNFQSRVLAALDEKLKAFDEKHKMKAH